MMLQECKCSKRDRVMLTTSTEICKKCEKTFKIASSSVNLVAEIQAGFACMNCGSKKSPQLVDSDILCSGCGCVFDQKPIESEPSTKKDEDGRSLTTNSSSHGKIGTNRITGIFSTYFGLEDTLEQACELANRFIENRVAAKQTRDVMQITIADWFKSHVKKLNPPGTKTHHGITKKFREVCLHDLFLLHGVPYVQATDEEKKREKTYKTPVNDHRRKLRGHQKLKTYSNTCRHPLCPEPKVDRELEPTNGKHWEKYHSKGNSVCEKCLAFSRQNMDRYFDIISEKRKIDNVTVCPKDGKDGKLKQYGKYWWFLHIDGSKCYLSKALVETFIVLKNKNSENQESALNFPEKQMISMRNQIMETGNFE